MTGFSKYSSHDKVLFYLISLLGGSDILRVAGHHGSEPSKPMVQHDGIDARLGGTLEYISVPVGFRRTGRILEWNPPHVFEHEMRVDPHPQLPKGDAESVVRWELVRDGNNTIVTAMHSRLTKDTSLRFAIGWHSFLDRLAAQLNGENLPDHKERSAAVAGLYSAQYALQ